ncbi:pilus assembly protein TadE [Rhodococcus sp. ABRD24]|uniref:Rv3654c family TadE-like protein n=1 Tax=Rhodococcus sp. ABRD24 TaxID=2507582 RepID=UPI00103FC031|nr:Rv3654c family TadE-like protein [Rhodococcus sp. ABRD24]QBJ97018.1 pilus assembly protein TadE [Rhodococcus sp. ABRD24]
MRRSLQDESGGATILACCALAVLVAVTTGLLHFGGAVSARHRAQSAADLSALAAASALSSGDESACGAAASIITRMGVELARCTVDGWDVVVEATVATGPVSLGTGPARARARAGPADEPS